MNEVILIGVSGSGTEEVAAELSHWQVVIVDRLVEQSTGMRVEDLALQNDGQALTELQCEMALRVLAALEQAPRCVVVGPDAAVTAPVKQALAAARKRGSKVVELYADEPTLSRRLGLNAPRSVGLGPVRALWRTQVHQYRQAWSELVDEMIDTSAANPSDIAAKIVALSGPNAVS